MSLLRKFTNPGLDSTAVMGDPFDRRKRVSWRTGVWRQRREKRKLGERIIRGDVVIVSGGGTIDEGKG